MNLRLTGTFDITVTGDETPGPAPPPAPVVLPNRAVFPATDPWNTDISASPVDAGALGTNGLLAALHPDFASALWNGNVIGIPYNLVTGAQPKVPVVFQYASESDAGPYPIPANPKLEGSADAHLILIDVDNWMAYELFDYSFDGTTHHAGSGAIWNLATNTQRPKGWTSADAAGLPIFPGLVRYDEVAKGAINHALRVTVKRTKRAYVAPANHWASTIPGTDAGFLPMGARIRLKAGYSLVGFSQPATVVLTALKRFGAFVADNGSAYFLSGEPNPLWQDDLLADLKRVKGSDLEVVQLGVLTTG